MLPPAWQTVTAAFAANADAAMLYQRVFFSRPVPSSPLPSRFHSTTTDTAPPHFSTIPLTVDDIQTRYYEHFCRAMRMPVDAFVDLVDSLRPRLPRRALCPACHTAIALRYLGGGSYLRPRVGRPRLLRRERRSSTVTRDAILKSQIQPGACGWCEVNGGQWGKGGGGYRPAGQRERRARARASLGIGTGPVVLAVASRPDWSRCHTPR